MVTVSSLAVELQAGIHIIHHTLSLLPSKPSHFPLPHSPHTSGGLTQEHVEYVCDHMNHEDRGLVEFLDYLTYVPLFVEIHDNISDNPLDFTRTK